MKSEDGQFLVAEIQRKLCVGLPFDHGDSAVISAIVRTVEERENERSSLLQFLYEAERQLSGARDWDALAKMAAETNEWLKRWRMALHRQNPTEQRT